MNNEDNNHISSIDDAIKGFETMGDSTNPPIEPDNNNVFPQNETISSNDMNSQVQDNSNGNGSLMKMLEEQEKNKKHYSHTDPDFYLKHYIGDSYVDYKNGGFSFAYFFLAQYYLFYRKMYTFAASIYAIEFIMILIARSIYSNGDVQTAVTVIVVMLIVRELPAFIIKNYYYNSSKDKVKNILETNKDKSENELINICTQAGGVNIIAPIILAVVSSLFNLL